VRDPNLTIAQLVAETSAKTGENITVNRFTRYRVGDSE
jgi:translation elongation factor EF-Ts